MEYWLMADIFIATFQNYEKFANGVLKQDVRDIDMITKLFETLKERGQIDESTDSYLAAVSMHGMIAIDFMILIFVPEGTITPDMMREQLKNQMTLLFNGLHPRHNA